MRPDFSVITPNLNGGRYLRECLESVATQEGVVVEHLLMDGFSTDNSLEIAAGFGHVQVFSKSDRGMCEAINRGYELATGEWILWLNSDDRLIPGVLRRVLAFARENSTADIIHGDTVFIDQKGSCQRRKRDHSNDEFVSIFGGSWMLSTSTFVRRRLIETGLRVDESYRIAMDYELFLRAARQGAVFRYFAEPVAEFRWHGANLSLLHDTRRRKENERLLHEHARARQWPSWLVSLPLRILFFPIAKAKRSWLRWREHGRWR